MKIKICKLNFIQIKLDTKNREETNNNLLVDKVKELAIIIKAKIKVKITAKLYKI